VHVAVKATTKRAAARGIIKRSMPASVVEAVDISFCCRPCTHIKARKARVI